MFRSCSKNKYQLVYGLLIGILLLSWAVLIYPKQAIAEDNQYFSQTGHNVSGKFLQYWQANGGMTTFGYPITDTQNEVDPETGKTFLTQWFERNRFELHPENAGTKYEVLLGLLGKDLNRNPLNIGPFVRAGNNSTGIYINDTGHNLSDQFLDYWNRNGGLARFGLPISEEFSEVDPETGHSFVVQWFERARFEKHPENQPPYDVLLGLLGKQIKGGNQSGAFPTFNGKVAFNKKFYVQTQKATNLAIDQQNNLYIADTTNHKILKYSGSSGQPLLSWDVPFGETTSFVVHTDKQENVYASYRSKIEKYTTSGNFLKEITLPDTSFGLVGVDAAGNLYGSETNEHPGSPSINKYDPDGIYLRSWLTGDEDGDALATFVSELIVDNNGFIYLSRMHVGSTAMTLPVVQKYDSQDNFIKSWYVQTVPSGLNVDPTGNLYMIFGAGSACGYWGGAIKYDSNGNKIVSWGDYNATCNNHSQDGDDGRIVVYGGGGMAVDDQGNIFTLDRPRDSSGNTLIRIQKFVQS